MSEFLNAYGIRRIFVLGAGFSAPARLPMPRDLLKLIFDVATTKSWHVDGRRAEYGQAEWLLEELRWYFPLEEWSPERIARGVDLEQFLSLVAATSAFVEGTGKDWNEHGDELLVALKTWLGQALAARQREVLPELPAAYEKFVRSLTGSLIISFNWDTILETLLDATGRAFALDLRSLGDRARVPILKLHGSIDWFSSSRLTANDGAAEPLPAYPDWSRLSGNLVEFYESAPFGTAPWLVVPSFDKISQIRRYGDVWKLPWRLLHGEFEVVVIGYSMRPDDFHARAFLYPQLVDGTRRGDLTVKVVDLAEGDAENEVKARYAGVEGVRYFFSGFGDEALEFIASN